MKTATATLSISLSLSLLMGCRTTQVPATNPNASTTIQPTKATNDPALKDCEAISDPAQAEDCRLWKGVAQAKKKSHANNVVKHSPGSIQQP